MRRSTVAVAVLALLTVANVASASVTVYFSDQHKYWKDWSSPANKYTINSLDYIGVPNLFGGEATGVATIVNNNGAAYLASITIGYNSKLESSTVNALLRYGDLFLATGSSLDTWNYVVRGDHSVGAGTASGYNLAAGNTIPLDVKYFKDGISQTKGVNDSDYLLAQNSTQRNTNLGWNGYIVRYDHPWALSDSGWAKGTAAGDGTAAFSGWQDNKPSGSSTWTFDPGQIMLTVSGGTIQPFRIGFSPQCANDVLIEDVGSLGGAPNGVPEPASLFAWSLLACLGALAVGARRFRKNG